MYTLADVRNEYNRLDQKLGIDTTDIKLTISTRATRRYGFCRYKNNKPVEINITDFILRCEHQFWDTIRHEYAHAYVKILCPQEWHGHDKYWKAACSVVGCNPERVSYNDEAAKYSEQRRETKYKYEVICKECGQITRYCRKGEIVKIVEGTSERYRSCSCNHCGSHDFDLKYI